ncbi:lambda family phage portal protein [Rhodovulum bhavnagarense]|uniref:Lambda family phage portal protein n=1 Tax=Rhodovulum bhavnagarense TaxID=992286 RepID=A0A4R2RJ33_9RHOB|nr:phage portal protein [Rhodovulum bhavnagarense]TCP62167.1 lambda family phage portal protein [Rhodovulum bhavnagarense]
MRSLKGVSLSRIIGTAARAFHFPAASHMAQGGTGGNHRRSLDAATGGRRGGGLGTFGPINSEVSAGLSLVGSRAAYQAVNNPYIANAVANLVTALVGTGQRPNVRGVERELRRQLHYAFDRFCETADHAGRTDFGGLLAQIARDMVVYGEGLAVMHNTADGLQIQVIPPDHLDPAKTEILRDGRQIVQGVEFDASGRRVAYWIFPERPHSVFADHSPAVRVEAAHVLHVFHPIAPGQVRGLSWVAPAVVTANELNQWKDATLVGAKMSAMQAGFITDTSDIGGDEELFAEPTWEPGGLVRLPLGTDVKFSAPDQIKDAPALLRMTLQELAAALGVPEFLLSGDLTNANYSSLRAGLIPFRARIDQVQHNTLVPQVLRPVWRRWLALEILAGRIDAPADTPCDWIMPRPQQVDPAKDLEATEKALALGLTSRTNAINELGWNADDIDEEIQADRAREAELGLTFATPTTQPTNPKEGTDAA